MSKIEYSIMKENWTVADCCKSSFYLSKKWQIMTKLLSKKWQK